MSDPINLVNDPGTLPGPSVPASSLPEGQRPLAEGEAESFRLAFLGAERNKAEETAPAPHEPRRQEENRSGADYNRASGPPPPRLPRA
jgi:hypothetical protein